MSQCRRKRGEMRDKENRKGARRATKPSDTVKALAPTQAKVPLTPNNTSRVRRVPDFNKLHKSFQLQMEKAKKNKQPTEFKTFDLTPVVKQSVKYNSSSKGVKEQQETARKEIEERREDGSEEDEDKGTRETSVDFEPRPDCLQAILNNQPVLEPAPQTPTDIGSLKRGQPRVMGVALSPGQQIRLSVYTKRERTLRKLLQSKASDGAGLVSAGGSCPRPSEFHQLLQDMVRGTATTLRTVSRLARGEGTRGQEEVELEGVKLRLESQLEEAAEETMASESQPLCHTLTPLTKPHPLPDTPTGHTTSVTHPLDHHLSLPLYKPSFYHEEPELKAIVWRTAVCRSSSHHSEDEKRPTCPLARLLDQCYITSPTDMISTTENT